MKNVVITGYGLVSSLGNSPEEMFNALEQNKSGVQKYEDWQQYNGLGCYLGAPAPKHGGENLARQIKRSMSPMSVMAYTAAVDALSMANIVYDEEEKRYRLNRTRSLMALGSTTGSPQTLEKYFKKMIEEHGPRGQLSTSFFKVMNHSVAANLAAAINFTGPLLAPSSACSTSTQCLIMGMELIQSGAYDLVIAGGADEIHYTSAAVFDVVKAASTHFNDDPQSLPGPFDSNRDGLVVSEGASVVILESEDHARSRGAKVLGELLGGAYLCDGTHMTQPKESVMNETMGLAMERACVSSSEIEYVNAHATGTMIGDEQEARAIVGMFPENVMVSSLKGHFGHSLAACGGIEVISTLLMMKNGLVIGNRNLKNPSEACEGHHFLQENIKREVNLALSNNFAFGGMNTCVIIRNHS